MLHNPVLEGPWARGLGQQLLDDFAVDIREAEVTALVTVGQAGVFDAHQV